MKNTVGQTGPLLPHKISVLYVWPDAFLRLLKCCLCASYTNPYSLSLYHILNHSPWKENDKPPGLCQLIYASIIFPTHLSPNTKQLQYAQMHQIMIPPHTRADRARENTFLQLTGPSWRQFLPLSFQLSTVNPSNLELGDNLTENGIEARKCDWLHLCPTISYTKY